jgi:tetratricopeptide (TPR) repeat protein
VFPMVLNNYARILREVNRLDEAADYAERSYAKAVSVHQELVTSQSLLERGRIYLAQHKPAEASGMLNEVEPRLRERLPKGHYAFAALAADRGMVAEASGDLPAALRFENQAVEIVEAAIKAGGEGAFALPGFLVKRSIVEIEAHQPDQAVADANRALTLLQTGAPPGTYSSRTGTAYLALARALEAQGKHQEAQAAARLAATHLQNAVGLDHPDTRAAQELASGP